MSGEFTEDTLRFLSCLRRVRAAGDDSREQMRLGEATIEQEMELFDALDNLFPKGKQPCTFVSN